MNRNIVENVGRKRSDRKQVQRKNFDNGTCAQIELKQRVNHLTSQNARAAVLPPER